MVTEDEIAEVYEDYLEKQDNLYLLSQLLQSYKIEKENVGYCRLEDCEHVQLISMIQNIDNTGKLDCGFEDLRKSVSTNNGCG